MIPNGREATPTEANMEPRKVPALTLTVGVAHFSAEHKFSKGDATFLLREPHLCLQPSLSVPLQTLFGNGTVRCGEIRLCALLTQLNQPPQA